MRLIMRLIQTPQAARLQSLLFLIALGSQTSLLCQKSQPRIAYRISVDSADLSGFNVEMRIRGAGEVVRLAMAAHPIYDDQLLALRREPHCRIARPTSASHE